MNTTKGSIDSLYLLQKRALKTIMKLPRDTGTVLIFNKVNKLPLINLYDYHAQLFIYNVLNGLTPEIFKDYFVLIENVHKHDTRAHDGLYVIPCTKKTFKNSLKAKAKSLWDSIPKIIQASTSIYTFKKLLKLNYLNSLTPLV